MSERLPIAAYSDNTEDLRIPSDPNDLSWQDYANCRGVDRELFFPERGESTKEAKAVCRGCVVREVCLEYALNNREKFGIWGGMSERQRRRIRGRRIPLRLAKIEQPEAEPVNQPIDPQFP